MILDLAKTFTHLSNSFGYLLQRNARNDISTGFARARDENKRICQLLVVKL